VARGPLDEFDPATVRIGDERRLQAVVAFLPRVDGLDPVVGQDVQRVGHRLDLYDEVAHVGATLDRLTVVNELDGDELILGKLKHAQMPDRRLGHAADELVADGRVERQRPPKIGHPQSDV
jgi:hypothetical protein